MAVAAEVCENCGAKIGSLETPMLWQEHVVCAECHRKLSSAGTLTEADIIPAPAPQPPPVPVVATIPYASPLDDLDRANQVVYAPTFIEPHQHVQLIEKTSKKWKAQILFASLLFISGIVATCLLGALNPALSLLGIFMLFTAMIWLIVARIGAWWEHG